MFGGGAGGEPRELPLAVAEEGKAKVVAFQAYLPLISAVCNPGLRERHWEALAELVGFTIKRDEVRTGPLTLGLSTYPICYCLASSIHTLHLPTNKTCHKQSRCRLKRPNVNHTAGWEHDRCCGLTCCVCVGAGDLPAAAAG